MTLSNTKSGDGSEALEAFFNIQVNARLALRAALYSSNEGGYIDNVPGTFTTNPAINKASLAGTAVKYDTADNTSLVEDDFNTAKYSGGRFSARGLITEDWDILFQHTEQELEADGVFDYDPEVGDLQANRFFPDSLDDQFGLTTWTLEGRLGMLDLSLIHI